jgi:hypothetical protein
MSARVFAPAAMGVRLGSMPLRQKATRLRQIGSHTLPGRVPQWAVQLAELDVPDGFGAHPHGVPSFAGGSG